MFIAHLPAGFILTKTIQRIYKTNLFLWLGLIASILPDIDLIYFYVVDHRQTLHHDYWIHLPFYWLLIGILYFSIVLIFKRRNYLLAGIIFFANIFLHLFLDAIVGGIAWFYPFSDKAFFLFEVPAQYDFWIYNFIFHWTFLFELSIIFLAVYLYIKDPAKQG